MKVKDSGLNFSVRMTVTEIPFRICSKISVTCMSMDWITSV